MKFITLWSILLLVVLGCDRMKNPQEESSEGSREATTLLAWNEYVLSNALAGSADYGDRQKDGLSPIQIFPWEKFLSGDKLVLVSYSGLSHFRVSTSQVSDRPLACPNNWLVHFVDAKGNAIVSAGATFFSLMGQGQPIPVSTAKIYVGYKDSTYFDNEGLRTVRKADQPGGCRFQFRIMREEVLSTATPSPSALPPTPFPSTPTPTVIPPTPTPNPNAPPTATLKFPSNWSSPNAVKNFDVRVEGTNISSYRYDYFKGTQCRNLAFSGWTAVSTPIRISVKDEGKYALCVEVKNSKGTIASASQFWELDVTAPSAFTLSVASLSKSPVMLTWTNSSGAIQYSTNIYAADGSLLLSTPVRFDLSFQFTPSVEGSFSAQTVAFDAAGNQRTSNRVNFTVDQTPPSTPTLSGVPTGSTDARSMELRLINSDASTYAAVLIQSGDCSSGLFTATTSATAPITLNIGGAGNYILCAASFDAAGNMSAMFRTSFTKVTPVLGDFAIYRVQGTIFKKDFPMHLAWEFSRNAVNYRVDVSTQESCAAPVFSQWTSANRLDIASLPTGGYYLCVTAVDWYGVSKRAPLQYFQVSDRTWTAFGPLPSMKDGVADYYQSHVVHFDSNNVYVLPSAYRNNNGEYIRGVVMVQEKSSGQWRSYPYPDSVLKESGSAISHFDGREIFIFYAGDYARTVGVAFNVLTRTYRKLNMTGAPDLSNFRSSYAGSSTMATPKRDGDNVVLATLFGAVVYSVSGDRWIGLENPGNPVRTCLSYSYPSAQILGNRVATLGLCSKSSGQQWIAGLYDLNLRQWLPLVDNIPGTITSAHTASGSVTVAIRGQLVHFIPYNQGHFVFDLASATLSKLAIPLERNLVINTSSNEDAVFIGPSAETYMLNAAGYAERASGDLLFSKGYLYRAGRGLTTIDLDPRFEVTDVIFNDKYFVIWGAKSRYEPEYLGSPMSVEEERKFKKANRVNETLGRVLNFSTGQWYEIPHTNGPRSLKLARGYGAGYLSPMDELTIFGGREEHPTLGWYAYSSGGRVSVTAPRMPGECAAAENKLRWIAGNTPRTCTADFQCRLFNVSTKADPKVIAIPELMPASQEFRAAMSDLKTYCMFETTPQIEGFVPKRDYPMPYCNVGLCTVDGLQP